MRLALTGVRIWDGLGDRLTGRPGTIVMDRGKITSLLEGRVVPAGHREIEQAGRFALPGLIDAHVHLDLDAWLPSPDAQLAVPRADRDLRMIARAEAMVRAGITTARDLGAGEWRELALRDAILSGELPGPRLLCAGQPLTLPAGHCHFWGGGAASEAEQAEVIRRQLERGVDWIKVMATGGVFTKGSAVTHAQFSARELARAVAQAAEAGRAVAAHCHAADGIRNAAQARVRTIEHCSFAGEKGFGLDLRADVVGEVARSAAWVSPTINAGWQRRASEDGASSRFFERMSVVLAALRSAGVPLIASTDAGIPGVQHHRLAAGLVAFARYAGLTNAEALRAATSEAARALGIADVCGVLRPGLAADVLVVAGDPLQDLGALEQPLLVLARGRPL